MQLEDIILNVRVGRHLTEKQEDALLQFARGYDAPEAWRAIYRPLPMVERVIPVDGYLGMWLLQLTCKHVTLAHGSAEAVVRLARTAFPTKCPMGCHSEVLVG